MSESAKGTTGVVTLKKLATGNHGYEVSVPSTGPSLDEMRQASQTAQVIWDELEQKLNPGPERVLVADDGIAY